MLKHTLKVKQDNNGMFYQSECMELSRVSNANIIFNIFVDVGLGEKKLVVDDWLP
jgi:hypothetical protein